MSHLSLFEFTQVVKKTLEKSLEPTYWIVAEIGELKVHPKGHCYLELVEKQNEKITARMKATIWSYTYQNLHLWFEKITGTELRAGMKILVNAEIQFHESFGLSLNVRDIDANYTLGERQKLKQEVIIRLQEEGLIDMNKSLALPLVPQRVAIISSAHSAGYEDFLGQLKVSPYRFETSFFAAEMQGQDATKSIVEALKTIFKTIDDFDLVVILRGGGAQTDLDCFDTYLMGKAIGRFPIPVVTGIGHERDETVADLVARIKLKTPTAVAEFLIDGIRIFEDDITKYYENILGSAQHKALESINEISQKIEHIKYSSNQLLTQAGSQIRFNKQQVFSTIVHYKKEINSSFNYMNERIGHALKSAVSKSEGQINGYEQFFHFSDPAHTLQRGFTYTTINGKGLNKIKKLSKGEIIETRTMDHTIKSTIEEIN